MTLFKKKEPKQREPVACKYCGAHASPENGRVEVIVEKTKTRNPMNTLAGNLFLILAILAAIPTFFISLLIYGIVGKLVKDRQKHYHERLYICNLCGETTYLGRLDRKRKWHR